MNLTEIFETIQHDLNNGNHPFQNVDIDCRVEGTKQKLKDAISDGLSAKETVAYIEDYCCVSFYIDYDDVFQSAYSCFDYDAFANDFRLWLAQTYFNNDESTFPAYINLYGADSEFMKNGYGHKDDEGDEFYEPWEIASDEALENFEKNS